MEKNVYYSVLLDAYGEMLTPRQFEVVDAHYNRDLSLGEIAEMLGVSRQNVSDTLKKGTNCLRECEDKIKIVSRDEGILTKVKRAYSLLAEKEVESAKRELSELIEQMEG